MYKILVKLLANRMGKVLEKVIDNCRSIFLDGRQLLHSVLVANKVVEDVKRRKRSKKKIITRIFINKLLKVLIRLI